MASSAITWFLAATSSSSSLWHSIATTRSSSSSTMSAPRTNWLLSIQIILQCRVALLHFSWLLHLSFGYQRQRQRVPSIPVQTSRVAFLDLIGSLLLNQILRELKRTMLLQTLLIVVVVKFEDLRWLLCPSIAFVVVVVIGHRCRRFHRHCHVRSQSWLLLQSLDDQINPFSTTTSSWLSSWYWFLLLREYKLLRPSWLSGAVIPKYPFTSAKIAEYFVRE